MVHKPQKTNDCKIDIVFYKSESVSHIPMHI